MKQNIITLLFCTLTQILLAQSIKGVVIDGISNEPIPNVNIQVQNSSLGSNTNDKGEFDIELESDSTNLIFSHVNYEKHTEKIKSNSKLTIVKLFPRSNILDEVSISGSIILDTISRKNEYSVSSFELIEDYIFFIENHGINKMKFSFKNLNSNLEKSIWLDTIKNVKSIQKSCSKRLHLLSKNHVYEISIVNNKIIIGEKIAIQEYNEFIKPCILKNENDLYYQRSKFNGLQTSYVRYNIKEQSLNVFRTITEKELLDGYLTDLYVINQSKDINNITTNDQITNTKIRDLQEKGDFLSEVFYKPVVSNFIYEADQRVIILNHIDNQIEIYKNNILQKYIDIKYHESEKWLKHVVLDQDTKEIYTLFKSTKGIEIRRILIHNGESEFASYLDTDFPNFNSVKVHKGIAYFLSNPKAERTSHLLLSTKL